jgi:hypothetical protein
MRYTRSTILIPRRHFVIAGLLRPLLMAAPSLLLLPFWRPLQMLPARPMLLAAWLVATTAIAWLIALNADERRGFKRASLRLLNWRQQRA